MDEHILSLFEDSTVTVGTDCPICGKRIRTSDHLVINEHIDECLTKSLVEETPKKTKTKSTITPNVQSHSVCSSCGTTDGHLTSCHLFTRSKPSVSTSYYSANEISKTYNPFTVTCPYVGCGLKFPALEFAFHVVNLHSSAPQAYACPICPILGYSGYVVKKDTNLLSHIQSLHSDLLSTSGNPKTKFNEYPEVEDLEEENDFIYNPEDFIDVVPQKNVGSKFIDDIIKEPKPGVECSICFEEFQKGNAIVRMECFCVFHKSCINNWFQKSQSCPLHKE